MKDAKKVLRALEQVIGDEQMTIQRVADGWAVFINESPCGPPRPTLYAAIADVLTEWRDAANVMAAHPAGVHQKHVEAAQKRLAVFEEALA